MRLGNWLLFALLGVILIQACCIAQVSCATANANWQYRYDISHSGYTTDNGTTNSARFLWCYGTGAPVQCSPGVADGIVVVGSRDGHIYGFDSASGTLKWCYIAGNLIEFSSPSIIDGRVYIGCINASIICLDLYTGMPYWTSYVEDVVRSSPLIVDGHVYVGSADCNLYCLDASNGTIIWKYKTNGGIDCSPAYADGIVYFGSIDYHTYAVNASSGEEIWKVFTVHGLCSPAVQNGRVYLGCNNGSVLCLNAYTGAGIWQFHTSDWVVSSPALAYGCVYIGSEDNNVYCLNATDGKKIWQTATEYWVWSSPTVCEGNVYVGSDDYCIYCLDVYTGEIKWNWETNGAIHSSPAILNNTLYIGSDDYSLYAFQLCNATAENPAPRVYSHRTNATLIFDLISLAVFTVILAFFVRFLWSKRKNQTRPAVTLENKKVPWYIAHFDLLVILAILGFSSLYFISLDYMPLWAADEQTYTQYAYHMLKTGDYITPWSFGGQSVWIGKPPLQMWLVSLSFQVFGINNFGARFVTVIFSMLSLSMLYFLGKKLYNPYVGALSVLVLGTFANYIEFSRRAMIDIQLIFFMLASIYVFILSRESGKNRNRYLVLSGLLFGLALMTKQVQALLIPLILLGYLILSERKIRFGFKRFLVFLGIGLLVFVPWVIVMHFKFGEEFWLWTFLYSGYMRSINSLEGHVGDFTYYFYYLYTGENLLWAILLPFATAFCIFKGFFKKVKADVLVFVWIAVVFLVFTVAQTKLYWYILPAYPACALAIGSLLYKISQKLKTYQKTHKLPIKR